MPYVTGDLELINTLNAIKDVSNKAAAYALTGLAYEVRAETQGKLSQWVKMTRPFLEKSVVYESAKASDAQPVAYVGFAPRANFATLLERGGERKPRPGGKAIAVPEDAKTNSSGGISNANRPKAVLQKKGVFSGVIDGVAGIWQSGKRIPLKLLYVYKPTTHYKTGYIHFIETAQKVFNEQYTKRFEDTVGKFLTKNAGR